MPSEVERLRAENARLQHRVDELEKVLLTIHKVAGRQVGDAAQRARSIDVAFDGFAEKVRAARLARRKRKPPE